LGCSLYDILITFESLEEEDNLLSSVHPEPHACLRAHTAYDNSLSDNDKSLALFLLSLNLRAFPYSAEWTYGQLTSVSREEKDAN
jgi:hypothetical protein